jgi:hypothetical protein
MPLCQMARFTWYCFPGWIQLCKYSEVQEPQCVMVSVQQGLSVGTCTKIGTLHSLEIIQIFLRSSILCHVWQ